MKLFILPFDHRSSFLKISKKKKEIQELKQIIFEGFLKVYEKYPRKKELAILIDEEYGEKIIKEAKEKNIQICLPVEKSGQDIFQLAYRDLNKIKKINPAYIKVLVRYNPFNIEENKKQLKSLKVLNSFCGKNNYKLMFELLVPPTKLDLKLKKDYDKYLRFDRTLQAIEEIQKEIKVDIWKLEGFKASQWEEIIARIDKKAKVIFLGRGESKQKINQWIKEAKDTEGIIGFAIGRTTFLSPIKKYLAKKISREKCSLEIAKNFKSFIARFEQ